MQRYWRRDVARAGFGAAGGTAIAMPPDHSVRGSRTRHDILYRGKLGDGEPSRDVGPFAPTPGAGVAGW